MLTPSFFAGYEVVPDVRWERAIGATLSANMRLTSTRISVSGLENLPDRPALLATNSTQKYDFLAFRHPLFAKGVRVVTVTKGKNYHSAPMAVVLGRTGVIPLSSRGYILLCDFVAVHGRRPTDAEYRALRDHVNDPTSELPRADVEPLRSLLTRRRDVVGHPFDPRAERYGEALRRTYRQMMAETLRLSREAVAAGYHIQMYPEGTVAPRLGVGRVGAVQLAWALGLTIVPVGMSGCPQAFAGASPLFRGGHVHIEIGAPMRLPEGALPADFEPFSPSCEARHKRELQAMTDEIMAKIDGLVDARHKRPAIVDARPTDPRKHL